MEWDLGRGVSSPANYGFWGSVVSSPSRVWGGAPAANDFSAFYLLFHAL